MSVAAPQTRPPRRGPKPAHVSHPAVPKTAERLAAEACEKHFSTTIQLSGYCYTVTTQNFSFVTVLFAEQAKILFFFHVQKIFVTPAPPPVMFRRPSPPHAVLPTSPLRLFPLVSSPILPPTLHRPRPVASTLFSRRSRSCRPSFFLRRPSQAFPLPYTSPLSPLDPPLVFPRCWQQKSGREKKSRPLSLPQAVLPAQLRRLFPLQPVVIILYPLRGRIVCRVDEI